MVVLGSPAVEYSEENFRAEAAELLAIAESASHLEVARQRLFEWVTRYQFDVFCEEIALPEGKITRVRDCARTLRSILKARSDALSGFSVAKVFFDLAKRIPRPDLKPAFFADLTHLVMGLETRGPSKSHSEFSISARLTGRRAALARSSELDRLGAHTERWMQRYPHGLMERVQEKRRANRDKILDKLNASIEDWNNWHWQISHIVRKEDNPLLSLVNPTEGNRDGIRAAGRERVPFGITPYYLSLMDECPSPADRSIRAQVFPSVDYVEEMSKYRASDACTLDFMQEHETSPVDLVTRRYPGIVIFKPYNSCPQICVYCQRNWEITDVLAEDALASPERIDQAMAWVRAHPTIHEVLVTGGDPLTLEDDILRSILTRIANIPTIERIRIGTRTLVTLPMRITADLAKMLGSFRILGRREMAVVTHVQHPYEVTPDMVTAVERLRREGISVYNQLVYTFFVSRRFEAALLRRLLRPVGIDPYYTFNTKGKSETRAYRVPIARLMQEQKEEARVLPGLGRTDEAVFNVPGLGKNYLRAVQHHDLLTIRPNGARVYEFHPWEKNISMHGTYLAEDIPILEYLHRLESIGEDPSEYETIWYYY